LSLGDGWRGHAAGIELFQTADLLLAAGTRFGPLATSNQTMAIGAPIVHVDVDATEIGKHYPAETGLVGDAKRVLQQLLAQLKANGVPPRAGSWYDVAGAKAARRASLEPAVGPTLRVLDDIRAALPRNTIVVHDLNLVSYWAGFGLAAYEPRTSFYPNGFGCLGFALPAAIGAKLARPERPVVALAGDGGCLFTCQELATAAQYGVQVVLVVFNDAGYGALRADQARHYGGRVISADLSRVDFVELARAFGVRGVGLSSLDQLGPALADALQRPGPTVIEAPSPAPPPPWIM
jgi:acetolactate synthase-1/2/3 large subunit